MLTRNQYSEYLKKRVFRVSELGQFKLMFDLIDEINNLKTNGIAIIERSYIYNEKSIFVPLFIDKNTLAIDFQGMSAADRKGFQESWMNDADIVLPNCIHQVNDNGIKLECNFDLLNVSDIFIPNVLHHCRDFPSLIELFLKKSKKIERVHIFDSYIREGHQYPDDFCRYTISALEEVFKKFSFYNYFSKEYGNIFDGILYLRDQAKNLLETKKNLHEIKLLLDKLEPELRKVCELEDYRPLGRPYASFSSSYIVSFSK